MMDSSLGDDAISITSSTDEEGEFAVEAILTVREADDGEPYFLVRWKDYPDERCTWQNAESFLDPQTLADWAETLNAGRQPDEDHVEKIIAKVDAYQDATELRKSRRQSKRRRLERRLSSSTAGTRPPEIISTSNKKAISAGAKTNPSTVFSKLSGFASDCRSVNDGIVLPRPLFHGISARPPRKEGQQAHRSANKNSKSINFRNLRHLNNARKVACRERTPDISRIQLRAPEQWGEAAAEDDTQGREQQGPPATPVAAAPVDSRQEATKKAILNPTSTYEPLSSEKSALISEGRNMQHRHEADEPPSYQHHHDDRDHSRGQQPRLRTFPNGRFYYFPGEFVATMMFGDAQIGDVRIKGTPFWSIGVVFRSKPKGENLTLAIGKNDVVTLAQWAQLCTGRSNSFQPAGAILSYEDTEEKVSQMERYLFRNDLAALWYHPYEDLMLVFYSPNSKTWSFLERMGSLPVDSNIRVLTRNKMQATEILSTSNHQPHNLTKGARKEELMRPPGSRSSFSLHEIDTSPTIPTGPRNRSSSTRPRRRSSTATDEMSPMTSAYSDRGPAAADAFPRPLRRHPRTAQETLDTQSSAAYHQLSENDSIDVRTDFGSVDSTEFHLRPGETIDSAFRERFRISYAHLTNAPPSKTVDSNPAKARFYLCYPKSAHMELERVKEFLRLHTFQTNICSSVDQSGWDAFQNIYNADYIGVILFYDDFVQYHKLPSLAGLLRSSSLSVFRLSLSRPLSHCDESCHIERLFPSGMALLLTEAVLVSDGVAILNWFSRKRRGDSWKLVLPPDVRRWLQNMALETGKGSGDRFIEMLNTVDILHPSLSTAQLYLGANGDESCSEVESMDGLSDPSGSEAGPIVSPLSIPSYMRAESKLSNSTPSTGNRSMKMERILLDYFAGWSIVNVKYHRRFIAVITSSDDTYHKRWGHIDFLTPDKFMKKEGIAKAASAAGCHHTTARGLT